MEEKSDVDDDLDPLTALISDSDAVEHRDGPSVQHHHLRSIDSTLVIRQLPSQGIGFQLWPAASTLVSLLDDHRRNPAESSLSSTLSAPHNHPLNILELGSGTGLLGIAAAAVLGARVTVTDLPRVVANLKHNAEANAGVLEAQGGAVHVAPLTWGEAADVEAVGREFDLVVASDVVYHHHLYEPLLRTLRLLMPEEEEEKMVFVMAHHRRWKKESTFFNKAKKLFRVDTIHIGQPPSGSRLGVVVYRFSSKGRN